MIDFLIVYEVKKRELENAYLLKALINSKGYSCDVANFYESEYYSLFGVQKYKIIIVPQLYHTDYVARVLSRFGPTNQIFNLQCEQVLSDDFEVLDLHTPKGEAKKAYHACWGQRTHAKLLKSGIDTEKLPILGSISLDFLRKEVLPITMPSRISISIKYGLDVSKKWVLFTSSFTFADMPDDRRKMDEGLLGLSLSERVRLFSSSRSELIKWLEEYLANTDVVFIYRPHPDEYNLSPVFKLQDKHRNLKIISDYNVRTWTFLADSVLNWYSTSCIEAYFLNKPYFLIRPLPIPRDIELTLMHNVKKIDSFQKFISTDFFVNDKDYHDESCLLHFYSNDYLEYNTVKYSRLLIKLIEQDRITVFDLPFALRLKSRIKTLLVYCLHNFYTMVLSDFYKPPITGSGSFLSLWFKAFYYNIASSVDKDLAHKISLSVLKVIQKNNC